MAELDCSDSFVDISYAVCVPTLNAGPMWMSWLSAVKLQNLTPKRVLVIDSSSNDQTAELAVSHGYEVIKITRHDFNHGSTRQFAADCLFDVDYIVFLTQDAILVEPNSISILLSLFSDPRVGVAYGRQLPRKYAGPIESHSRFFNYPSESRKNTSADIRSIGMKAAFTSNSFCAYRRSALFEVGGFPSDVILSEDMVVAARMIEQGWVVAYCAEAAVYHSHSYTLLAEFNRYFDIGVLHSRQSWLLERFGKVEGEGIRFIVSELKYMLRHSPWLIPQVLLRTLLKYIGYKLGMAEKRLSNGLKRKLSMHKAYWNGK